MHLIVARRDLTGFQHLHPEQRADGAWETPSQIGDAGSYRAVRRLRPRRRAADARERPARRRRRRPARAPGARADGASPTAATTSRLRRRRPAPARRPSCASRSRKDGEPVATEPYLGAGGHLVALREGDLAFLHVHPTNEAGAREIGFARDVPDRGPLPPVPAVPARRPRPDRRLHAGGALMAGGAPRAADHGHDLRVVRQPDRAQAQQARRRHGHRQLRHRAGDRRLRRRPRSSRQQLVAAVEAAGYAGLAADRRAADDRAGGRDRRRCGSGCSSRWR